MGLNFLLFPVVGSAEEAPEELDVVVMVEEAGEWALLDSQDVIETFLKSRTVSE